MEVVIVKFGDEVAPVAMVTVAGTVALGSLLDKVTMMPAAGAGLVSVTLFAVVATPPITEVGERAIDASATGVTVSVAVFTPLLKVAEIVTGIVAFTLEVVMVKFGEDVAPAAMVNAAGTVALGLLLDKLTIVSTDTGLVSVTLFSVVATPPITEVGDKVIDASATGVTVSVAVFTPPL